MAMAIATVSFHQLNLKEKEFKEEKKLTISVNVKLEMLFSLNYPHDLLL